MFPRPLDVFPPPERATADGIVAVGGKPDPDLLLAAYSRGIFPWPHPGLPLLWFCPDPRFVLIPREAHLSRSLRKTMRRSSIGGMEVRADTAFEAVIRGCARKRRPGQRGTWINRGMIKGYTALHQRGFAHSIEAWQEGRLVGGLYGISLGAVFYGESMFTDVPDASKVAFATLLGNLVHWDSQLVDCQSYTDHLATFGAEEWPRERFLAALERALEIPARMGPWIFDLDPAEAADQIRGGS
jgi:leucyl/phenylalanyl-tRNA--protein transferase